MAEGKGVEPSGHEPGTVFKTASPPRRCLPGWSRMQDSNLRGLFTRQVLWPVELIRQWPIVVRRAGIEPRDRHVISVPHIPSVLPASEHPWRESNSHFQLRKLALYPLSYRGWAYAPLAGLEPATAGSGNRCAIHCATRAFVRFDGS